MPLVEMLVGDQAIRYDPQMTAAIYAKLRNGWAEDCGCLGCRNLLVQRDQAYPAEFRRLLQRLGIDPNKESEVVADGPLDNGLHHYGGWFFFVGEIVKAGEYMSVVSESPYFGYFFSRVGPCPTEFRDSPSLSVAFEAEFEWVLNESWNSDLHRTASPKTGGSEAAIVETCTPEEPSSFTTVPENDRLPRLVDDNLG